MSSPPQLPPPPTDTDGEWATGFVIYLWFISFSIIFTYDIFASLRSGSRHHGKRYWLEDDRARPVRPGPPPLPPAPPGAPTSVTAPSPATPATPAVVRGPSGTVHTDLTSHPNTSTPQHLNTPAPQHPCTSTPAHLLTSSVTSPNSRMSHRSRSRGGGYFLKSSQPPHLGRSVAACAPQYKVQMCYYVQCVLLYHKRKPSLVASLRHNPTAPRTACIERASHCPKISLNIKSAGS